VLDLIQNRPLPRKYIFDVLFASVPLLEAPEDGFGVEGTEALMRALAALESSTAADNPLASVPSAQIEAVRLALARNLSRGLLA
jgi:hypothetical protein